MSEENLVSPENQIVDKARKKPAKKVKEKKDFDGVQLPVLVEFTYSVSMLILVVLGLTIAVTSLLSGAGVLAMLLRTSVTVSIMGGLLMFISSQVSSGLMFSTVTEREEVQPAEQEPSETDAAETESADDANQNEAEAS